MPPRKPVKKAPANTRRRTTSNRNGKGKKQVSAGILLIFVPLLLVVGYLALRSMGTPATDKPVRQVKAETAPKQQKKMDLDTLAPPPETFTKKQEPPKESPIEDNPEVTGGNPPQPEQPKAPEQKQQTQQQPAPDQTKEPEQKTAQPQTPPPAPQTEKPAVIRAINAVKLYMFDKNMGQDRMTVSGKTMTLNVASDKEAAATRQDLKTYLKNNKLSVVSSKPLTVKDSADTYTVMFNVVKPKAPEKKPEPPKPVPPKPQTQPQTQPKEQPKPQPKPAPVKKPEPPKAAAPAPKPLPRPQMPQAPKAQPKPQPAAQKQPVKYTAKIALVIDDCGYNLDLANKAASFGRPVTFAVIPYTPYARETARFAKSSGNTLFLHFPMQPKSYPSFDPGKGAILLTMPEAIIDTVTKADIDALGTAPDGANNHTGSALTADQDKITQTLTALKNYVPRFLDSRTSPDSKAYSVCRSLGMRCGVNSLFLDNEGQVSSDSGMESQVYSQFMKAAKMALHSGSIIVIGHLRKDTIAALPKAFADAEKMGVKVVPVTSLMN